MTTAYRLGPFVVLTHEHAARDPQLVEALDADDVTMTEEMADRLLWWACARLPRGSG